MTLSLQSFILLTLSTTTTLCLLSILLSKHRQSHLNHQTNKRILHCRLCHLPFPHNHSLTCPNCNANHAQPHNPPKSKV